MIPSSKVQEKEIYIVTTPKGPKCTIYTVLTPKGSKCAIYILPAQKVTRYIMPTPNNKYTVITTKGLTWPCEGFGATKRPRKSALPSLQE